MPLSAATDAQEAKYLKHIFNSLTLATNGTFRLALFSVAPTSEVDGTGGTEIPAANGYGRITITNDTSAWNTGTVATPSIKTNKIAFTWACATANWAANVVGWGLYLNDNTTLAHYQALPSAIAMTIGDTLTFAAGALSISVNFSSDFTSSKMADLIFGATTWASPVALVFKAYSTALTPSGSGTELSGSGYASVSLTSSGNWTTATAGTNSNSVSVAFPAAVGANWLPVQAIGLWSGSDLVWCCNLTSPVQVNIGNILKIAAGGAVTTLD